MNNQNVILYIEKYKDRIKKKLDQSGTDEWHLSSFK